MERFHQRECFYHFFKITVFLYYFDTGISFCKMSVFHKIPANKGSCTKKNRLLSLSGRLTLVKHDFGFINRKQIIIENFKNIERVNLPNSVRMVKTIAKSYV